MNILKAKVAEIVALDTCHYDASIFVDQSFFVPSLYPSHPVPSKPAVAVVQCAYCGVRQVPENVYECRKCGAPLPGDVYGWS